MPEAAPHAALPVAATGVCPRCGIANACAIHAGAPIETCWCAGPAQPRPAGFAQARGGLTCYCADCLGALMRVHGSRPEGPGATIEAMNELAAEGLGLAGLHHTALIASDYVRSRQFYVEVLGLPVIAETWRAPRQSWKLDLALPDGAQLEVFSFPSPPARPSHPEACGLRHLALRVRRLDAAIAHLQRHGVAVEPVRVDELTGARYTFFTDPDGLPLELVEELRTV